MELKIPILAGSNFDLTLFDFSFKDLKILDVQSKEYENYIESLAPEHKGHNLDFNADITKHISPEIEKRYAVVKVNPLKNYSYQDIENVWKILLIIFPSDLQILHIVHYRDEAGFFQSSYMTSYEKRMDGEYPGDLLTSADEDVKEINEYLKLVFDRLNNPDNYIGLCIENYLTSFNASHYHCQYLTLCMALESTIHGNEEVSYKLRRNIALLCGKDVHNCEIIHNNIKKLYKLRSTIIHGDGFEHKKVHEYRAPIRAIVSPTIIELLIHNIEKNLSLNDKLTSLGYGDREKISNQWKHFKLNISIMVETNWRRLE